MVAVLIASIVGVGTISQEISTYPDIEAIALSLVCGIVIAAILLLSACVFSMFLSRLLCLPTQPPKGARAASVCLVILFVMFLVAIVAGFVIPSSVSAPVPMGFYLISIVYTGIKPLAVIMCACAFAAAIFYSNMIKEVTR